MIQQQPAMFPHFVALWIINFLLRKTDEAPYRYLIQKGL